MSFARIRPRRGTKSQWESANTVLAEGELGVEVPNTGVGTGVSKMKIGDGTNGWNNLPYADPVDDLQSKIDNVNTKTDNLDTKIDNVNSNIRGSIEVGAVSYTGLTAGGTTNKTISFKKSYSSSPIVIASPATSSFDANLRVINTTSTGFNIAIKLPSSMTALTIRWIAIKTDI